MKHLLIIITLFCSCNSHNAGVKPPTNLGTAHEEKKSDTGGPANEVFFKLEDTLKDIHFINSFFVLVNGSQHDISITRIRKFFPTNEEELAYLDTHIKNSAKRSKMEDSIYDTNTPYKSNFFTSLAKVITTDISKKSFIAIKFDGFDVINNPEGNSHDTSYVKYKIYDSRGIKKMTFFIPYLRDNEYAIANIYNNKGESLIDKACH